MLGRHVDGAQGVAGEASAERAAQGLTEVEDAALETVEPPPPPPSDLTAAAFFASSRTPSAR